MMAGIVTDVGCPVTVGGQGSLTSEIITYLNNNQTQHALTESGIALACQTATYTPRADSRVDRIDPLRFLAKCHKS